MIVRARVEDRQMVPDEASNESVQILNDDIDCRKPSTSTSRKPTSRDTGNSMELYASSVSEIYGAKVQGTPGEGKMSHTWCLHEGKGRISSESSCVADREYPYYFSLLPILTTSWSFRSDTMLQLTSPLENPSVPAILIHPHPHTPHHLRAGTPR